MSKIKQLLKKRTWIGLLTALVISLALDAIGALLMSRGIIAEMPMWVYASYAIGGFVGVRIAVQNSSGTLLCALLLYLLLCGIIFFAGVMIFDGMSFRPHGWGVLLGLLSGCLCGALIGGGHTKKRRGKRYHAGKGGK